MAKNFIKELIIVLLLALAVILVLGVLLYEYVPVNKIIPEKVSYTTPENVREELQVDSNVDDTQIVLTHQIDATDLSNYKNIKEYIPGKKNPFEDVNAQVTTNGNSGSSTTGANSGNNSGANTGSNQNSNSVAPSSTDTNTSTGYLPDKGTK